MLSKSSFRTTLAVTALFAASCGHWMPWRNEPTGDEVNLAFRLDRNLVELQTVRLDNHTGRFILGTAAPRTAIDPNFHDGRAQTLQMGEKNTVRISPVALPLSGAADAIVGADAWKNQTITIDYRAGLVTFQKYAMEPSQMTRYRYRIAPAVNVSVDGNTIAAIVDTSSPDTLVLPRTNIGRGTANVMLANTDFGAIDVKYANVAQARIGNRLLSRFVVTIDYGRRVVGLWRDPRTSLQVVESSSRRGCETMRL